MKSIIYLWTWNYQDATELAARLGNYVGFESVKVPDPGKWETGNYAVQIEMTMCVYVIYKQKESDDKE